MTEHTFDGQYIDPLIQAPLRAAMVNEDPRWFTTGPRLVDHPADRGGLTYGGITAKSWGAYRGLGRPATATELQAITAEQAMAFYYREYVLAPKFDWLPDQRLRALCIDWSFTSWHDDPWRAVQSSLKASGHYAGALDGIPGPATRAALLRADQRALYRDVFNARIRFYLGLALGERKMRRVLEADPSLQAHNLRGWINRVLEYAL